MVLRFISLSLLFLSILSQLFSQSTNKIPLDHSVYDEWQRVASQQVSPHGNIVAWEVNPQKGDGWLHWYLFPAMKKDSVFRAGKAAIPGEESFLAYQIAPAADSLRKAKLAKKKDDELPGDSLGIFVFDKGEIRRIPGIESFKVAKEGGNWMAYLYKPPKSKPEEPDSTAADSSIADSLKPSPPKPPKKNNVLVLFNPVTGDSLSFISVEEYGISPNGKTIAFTQVAGDSVDSVAVKVFATESQALKVLYEGPGVSKKLGLDDTGDQLAILVTRDTGEVKVFDLYYTALNGDTLQKLADRETPGMPVGWAVSEHGDLKFSADGSRILMATAPVPVETPEDTLLDDEKVKVDIWNWQDSRIQPQQLVELKDDKNKSFEAVWHIDAQKFVQLEDELLDQIYWLHKGNDSLVYGFASSPYYKFLSWQYPTFKDVYVVNVKTGDRVKIMDRIRYATRLTPGGNHIIFFDPETRNWNAHSLLTGEKYPLTDKLKVNFYDEDHDMPSPAGPYQIAGFGENDAFVLLNDRYDIWKIDPYGREKPQNITRGFGRKNHIRLDVIDQDPDNPFVEDELLLLGTNENTKREAFYRVNLKENKKPVEIFGDDAHFSRIIVAKESNRILWTRETFQESENLWTGFPDFSSPRELTKVNPQQEKYRWGKSKLVHWKSYSGRDLEGILFTPEDLDPNKKYPLLVYFYEEVSDRLHWYTYPAPGRSTINASYYVSNEYIVFFPNVEYTTGQPGEDAFDAIVSGTDYLVDNFSYIDSTRMGLQGHSWGGYQAAYIATQTDKYAAIMGGAVVSNMTSAYGGVRWESGWSRMFQYEESQSRLGTTLWEDPERYIKNSPLFYADQVTTPFLTMHNDNDGAVPWYQGIEFFLALRRLNKPVWLINYNGEPHNLLRRANMVDLTIRMQQFFDHYLKGAPAPVWMTDGIPAIDKGKTLGYELEQEEE